MSIGIDPLEANLETQRPRTRTARMSQSTMIGVLLHPREDVWGGLATCAPTTMTGRLHRIPAECLFHRSPIGKNLGFRRHVRRWVADRRHSSGSSHSHSLKRIPGCRRTVKQILGSLQRLRTTTATTVTTTATESFHRAGRRQNSRALAVCPSRATAAHMAGGMPTIHTLFSQRGMPNSRRTGPPSVYRLHRAALLPWCSDDIRVFFWLTPSLRREPWQARGLHH